LVFERIIPLNKEEFQQNMGENFNKSDSVSLVAASGKIIEKRKNNA